MIIEFLTLGDELLDGRRIDTNTAWLGRHCTSLGVPPKFRQTTSDDLNDIAKAFELALSRSDFIISTGGLGPTADDLTFEALAKATRRKLIFHPDIFEKIERRFLARGLECPDQNKRQAYLPEGAQVISNELGTAPGVILEMESRKVVSLPGVPSEMELMFNQTVLPLLEKRIGVLEKRIEKIFRLYGLSESHVEKRIEACGLHQIPEVRVAYTAGFPIVDVTLSILGSKEISETAQAKIEKEFGKYIIARDSESLESRVVHALQEKKWKIAVAESITGGSIASALVSVPGSSQVLERGYVTYSNASKQELLQVSSETLERWGAVSKEIALEMARGAKNAAKVEVGLSTTGIAGPNGGTAQKPVGLTFVAWVGPGFEEVKQFEFRWDRNRNRMLALYEALKGLIDFVASPNKREE